MADREFRGFGYVKATDSAGTTSETWYLQDDIFKGLVDRQETRDSGGNLYSKSDNTYQSTSPYTGVDFPYLERKDDYLYDGTGSYRQTRTEFEYDSYGNMTWKKLLGKVVGGNPVTGDERYEITDYDYDTANWLLARPWQKYVRETPTGANKAKVEYTYWTGTNLIKTETKWLSGGTSPVTSYTYDAYGNIETITDPCKSDGSDPDCPGSVTKITYDPATHTYSDKKTYDFGGLAHEVITEYYPEFGKIKSETDPNGNITTYAYDKFGRPETVVGPYDNPTYPTVTYAYLDFGTVGSQKVVKYGREERGTAEYIWSETYFDGLGRTIRARGEGPTVDAVNKVVRQDVVYNNRGLKESESLPYFEGLESSRLTTYQYDAVGRITQVTNTDGTYSTATYDKGRTTFIDENGHKKVEEQDVYGNLITVDEYTGVGPYAKYATTTYTYDVLGNLETITDDGNNVTTVAYDTLGRKTDMVDPDMGTWSYTYDANGNLKTQTDAKLETITFKYDSLNRVDKKIYPDQTFVDYVYDELSTGYYNKGHLTTMTDASGTTEYFYDKLGRMEKSIRTIDSTNYVTETGYDALGRVKTVTYPDSEVVTYNYDEGGNLKEVVNYAAYSDYNALGQAGRIDYANGANTVYQYRTDNNRLNSITTNGTSGGLQNLSYGYDNVGNISGINDIIDSSRSQTFVYDDLDRLKHATSTSYGTRNYDYDEIGNMTLKAGVSYSYTAGNDGSGGPHAVKSTTGKSFVYDGNGNMKSDGTRTIAYDYDNMPSSVTISGSVTSFIYDGAGGRVKKVTPSTTIVYVGNIYECVAGTCKKYVFAGDARIAVKEAAGDTYYYHQDHLGSSSVVTDSSGGQVEEIHYYPYGESRVDSGSVSVSHKFTSQELDGETGLYYYGARYYDPELGRFISPDSIVPDPSNPQALNRYSYVLNNPLRYTDPTGHSFLNKLLGGLELVVGALVTKFGGPAAPLGPAIMADGAYRLNGGYDDAEGGSPPVGLGYSTNGGANFWIGSPENNVDLSELGTIGKDEYVYGMGLRLGAEIEGTFYDTGWSYNFGKIDSAGNRVETGWFDVGGIGYNRRPGRLPDYYSGNLNVGVFVGWTGKATLDRYGNIYFTFLGDNMGKSATPISGSLTAGYLSVANTPTEKMLRSFNTGASLTVTGGFWGGTAVTYSGDNGFATEYGFVSPQFGYSTSYQPKSWVIDTGISW